jgi:hypothetical protein
MVKLSEVEPWPSAKQSHAIHGIVEYKILSLDDLSNFFTSSLLDKKENYIFRGHRKNDWLLEPAIDRVIDKNNRATELSRQIEYFRKSIVGRRGMNPSPLENDECWALGQHFGLHTPLLDWTYSPYVALFFAFAKKGEDDDQTESRVLFCFNKKRVNDKCSTISDDNQKIEFYEPRLEEHQRMISQSGLFTISRSNLDIEKWITNNFSETHHPIILAKIHIANTLRSDILKQLDWMNINFLTVFPDLMGAAKHANLRLEIPGY